MDDTALTILRIADLLGVLGCALLGGLVARSRGFDPVGFAVLAVVSGLGGGIVRDVLLGQGPPVALTDTAYVAFALSGAAVAYLVPLGGRLWSRGFPIVDAVALGCWAAAGTQKTLQRPAFRMFGAPYTGLLTGVFLIGIMVLIALDYPVGTATFGLFALVVPILIGGWFLVRKRVMTLSAERGRLAKEKVDS